ncbi:hypothetical protein E2562_015951 [Oryza meyeriana var. granulata]|uniref:Uncharacterized protein n=1 Tax=Oryza meyeriana var. granulata TaxID=110450 RepID=A0A6G1CGM6_9ORYZ|nr:hypothetical protein E2562_015951 [Oryza meyeriana var. granulata]
MRPTRAPGPAPLLGEGHYWTSRPDGLLAHGPCDPPPSLPNRPEQIRSSLPHTTLHRQVKS